jgi:hypothetical protein
MSSSSSSPEADEIQPAHPIKSEQPKESTRKPYTRKPYTRDPYADPSETVKQFLAPSTNLSHRDIKRKGLRFLIDIVENKRRDKIYILGLFESIKKGKIDAEIYSSDTVKEFLVLCDVNAVYTAHVKDINKEDQPPSVPVLPFLDVKEQE